MVDASTAGDENKKSKVADSAEGEEPRSKIPTDAVPSDDVPQPSAPMLCDLPADFDVYSINKFEIVTIGKEAGWPGQWEEVDEEEMTEDQLLYSLQLKGSAMSDAAWQEHWAQIGPSLLANGWLEQYPSVPLSQVEQVTGVTFLSQAAQTSELTNVVEKLSLNENSFPSEDPESKEGINKNLEPPDLSGLSIDDTAGKTDDQNVPKLVAADVKVADESQAQPLPQQQSFSNEEIAEIWLSFYNEYYWYCYQQFAGAMGRAAQQPAVNLVKDYVTAKKCYNPVDSLATPEENTKPVDNEVIPSEAPEEDTKLVDNKVIPSGAPDGEPLKQNATVDKDTNSHVNSEPTTHITAAKDNPVDINTPQNATPSCSDPQEDSKKETPDSQQYSGQTEKLPSQEDTKNEIPDTQERCKEEKSSERSEDNHAPPVNSNKNVTRKVETKHVWQLSKTIQYTSIVWALQEAGIITSDEAPSEVVDDQTPCNDQLHCNGTGSADKETNDCEGDSSTGRTPGVTDNTNRDAFTSPSSSASTINDTHDQLKQSLKRKR